MTSYLPFVGFVRFPRGTHDLSSEVCPACLVERVGVLCASCGLDLTSPFIVELDSSSMDVSAALDRRLELIGRIRHASAAASVLPAPAEPLATPVQVPSPVQIPSPAAAPVVTAPPVAAPVFAAAASAAPVVTSPAAATEPRRHLGVQVVLLIVGVSLLSIGAIFFLVYAFITFGLVWRSVIILAVTVAAIVGATLLKRRKLRATAEAIAALGIVFVYLDVFAVRANDLFAAGSADGLIYWGVALLLSAVGFTAWHRRSGLRLPSIVAFTTFAPGLALLVGGGTAPLDDGIRVFASFAALGIGGLTHPLGKYRAEKVIVAGFGIAGLVLAGLSTPFMPGGDWIPAVELAIIAMIALAQVILIATVGAPVAVGRAAAALGAIAAASAMLSVGSRISDPGFLAFWPVVGATTVALVLEIVARTRPSGLPRVLATVAAWSAGGVGVLTLLVSVGIALVPTFELTNGISTRWAVSGASTVTIPPSAAAAILALLVVVVLVGAAWAVSGTLDERLAVVLAAACAVLLLAVPLLGVLWAVVIAWLLIAAAGVVALWFGRVHNWSPGIQIVIMLTCLLGAALAYSASWASIDTWWFGSVGTVALLVASRVASPRTAVRAATLALAAVLALVAAAAQGWHINERFAGGIGVGLDSTHTTAALAIVLVACSALLAGRLSTIETRTLFGIGLTVALVAVSLAQSVFVFGTRRVEGPVMGDSVAMLALGIAALVALTLWVSRATPPRLAIERIAASILIAPAAALALESLARLLALPSALVTIAPAAAALVISGLALGGVLLRPRAMLGRRYFDIGTGLVSAASVLISVTVTPDGGWLVLVIAAVSTLVVAVSQDGLFSSTSRRKHVGWLALTLAAAGFWWYLMQSELAEVELFVLPLGGTLLLIALLNWRASRRGNVSAAASPFLVLAGLLVAVLPLATVSITGSDLRASIIVAACAVLLLAVSLARGALKLRPYLDVAAVATAIGLIVAGFGRPVLIARLGQIDSTVIDSTVIDRWTVITFVVLVAAAILQSGVRHDRSRTRRLEATQVVMVLAMAGLTVIELSALGDEILGTARAVTLLVILAAIHVAGFVVNRVPIGTVTGWIALAGAALTAITAVVVGAIDPFEWATIILAAAILTTGAVSLRRDPDAGSWPWLAPGMLVLLVPSLLATVSDAPIWRLVALGIACVIAIIVGALARLQAPLILGSALVLIHALRTFAPQLVAVYQLTEWWVWAVVGGAIILFVALTLEKRVRDLRAVGSRVSALR